MIKKSGYKLTQGQAKSLCFQKRKIFLDSRDNWQLGKSTWPVSFPHSANIEEHIFIINLQPKCKSKLRNACDHSCGQALTAMIGWVSGLSVWVDRALPKVLEQISPNIAEGDWTGGSRILHLVSPWNLFPWMFPAFRDFLPVKIGTVTPQKLHRKKK